MVVERALEKTREARYQHMSEMLADLDVYRQQLMLRDSPAFGRPASDVTRPGSDVRRLSAAGPAPPMSNAAGSDGARMASNAQTFAASAAPPPATPVPASPQVVDGTPSPVPVSPPVRRTPMLVAAIAAVIVLGAFATWMMRRDAPPPAAVETQGAVPSAAAQQELTNRLDQASQALQAGDGASALRHAEAVLAIDPNHPEGRRVRDRAQQISDTVSRRLGSARDHLAAGRFDEASRAAGEALAVEPGNAEARRLMDEGAAKSAGKGVDEARTRTTRARNAATAAAAPKLAAAAYGAALSAEREAASLHGRGRHAEAMAKFWEATGLFRSAEIAAQTEAAVRTARAQSAPPARPAAESTPRETSVPPAAPKPAPAPPPPVTPEPGTSGLPLPTSSLPSAPQIPPAAPPPAAQTPPAEPSTPPVSPTAGIKEVLDRYEAALESQSLEALKRLWPSLGGAQESAIRSEFQNANRIEVEILNPQITVTGSTATATFIRRYRLHTVDAQRPESETRTTMTLRRSGTAWTIEGMRFEAIR
jgi:tetratricopeptide (TPR) repeat protein